MHTLNINSGLTKRNRLVRREADFVSIAPINKKEKIEKMRISKKLYTTLIITVLTISAIMAAIPMASAEITSDPFLVHPFTGADVTTAAVGGMVKVKGNATSGQADPFAVVKIYWDSLAGKVLGTTTADNYGNYSINVVIPAATAGNHWIIANDGETESGGAQIAVTPSLTVANIPAYGPTLALPGDELAVTGHGYAPNDAITLFLNLTTSPTTSYVITTPAFTTNGTGSFSGTIVVPAIPMANFGYYEFNATDEASNSAVDYATIDYYITTYPSQGPTGIEIWIYGRIAPSTGYTIRFNGAAIATGTTDSSGSYFETYNIPAVLSPGKYPVDIWWATTESRSCNFTVTATPKIFLGATTGIAGDVVDIDGQDFVASADITLYFDGTIVNSTDMGTGFGPTGSAYGWTPGQFNETFVVPSLAPGVYAVSVVDSWGATSAAGVFFTITPTPLITVETRATDYYRHDVLSLYTWSNIVPTYDVYWEITDPTNNLFIYGYIYTSDWYMVAPNSYMVPYYRIRVSTYWNNQIPDDAPVGVWNFTAYNYATTAIVDSNLFSVNAKPDMQDVIDTVNDSTTTILDEIDECCSNMTTLLMELGANITEVKGEVAIIETTVGEIDVALTDLGATITSIEDGVANIDTTLGPISTQLTNLDATISGLDGDLVTIQTSIGAVQTKLDSVDVVVGVVAGDTAYLKSAVSNMTGTITDISDGVATIETDVGTLRMDVADLKTDVGTIQTDVDESLPVTVDMMPVWIAVVLSLIAAIAAIFAVVTIRQKIAG
jgi:archaellum component FlaC